MKNEDTFSDLAGNSVKDGPISDRVDKVKEGIDQVKCDVEQVSGGIDQVKNGVEQANEGIDDLKNKVLEMSDKISAADIAKKKQQEKSKVAIENTSNVSGNQQIIQNIYYGGYHYGLKEVTEKNMIPDSETRVYDLAKAEDFAAFGEEYKAGEHFAFAVMLSVFEYVELDDLQSLKASLMDELPKVISKDGKEIDVHQDPYFSINSLLKTIQGKMYETKAGEKCVGLGDSRSTALKNLWEQFPSIRGCISRWLLNVSDVFEYHTNFDVYQIATAFVNILKLDFSAGVRHIFQRFYSNSNNTWLLGVIALILYDDENYRERILPILRNWVSSSSRWKWRSAYYVYSYVKQETENHDFDLGLYDMFEDRFSKLLEYRIDIFDLDDVLYISRFLIYSERARTLVSRVLKKLSEKRMGYDNKQILVMIYLLCLRTGYFAVSDEYPAFPLVACDSKNQLLNVQPLAAMSLQRYETRRTLFSFIEAYLKELTEYSVEDKVIKHIKAYFVLLAERNARHVADIMMMLKHCKCQLANDIADTIKTKVQFT